jgi:hypothetical protein
MEKLGISFLKRLIGSSSNVGSSQGLNDCIRALNHRKNREPLMGFGNLCAILRNNLPFPLSSLIGPHNFRPFSDRRLKYSSFSVDEDVRDKQVKDLRIQRRMFVNEISEIRDVV